MRVCVYIYVCGLVHVCVCVRVERVCMCNVLLTPELLLCRGILLEFCVCVCGGGWPAGEHG